MCMTLALKSKLFVKVSNWIIRKAELSAKNTRLALLFERSDIINAVNNGIVIRSLVESRRTIFLFAVDIRNVKIPFVPM